MDPGGEETWRAESFDAHAAGYLRATLGDGDGAKAAREKAEEKAEEEASASRSEAKTEFLEPEPALDRPTRVVCVVGLAHCNGVLSRLADADVEAYR